MRDPLLWIACALYAALFTVLGAVKYAAHRNFVDFGIFAQTGASAFGCFCNGVEGSHWAFHSSPILYVAGALLAVWKSPLALVALQSVAGALVAPPIYAMVRARCDVTTARLVALTVLLYPPLAGVTFADFHENVFAPAAIAWGVWGFDAGLLGASAIAVAVALAVKEDQAIFLSVAGGIGGWMLRARDPRRARFALGVGIAGVAVAVTFFAFIQPHAGANPAWQPTRFYAWNGGDVRALGGGLLARAGFIVLAFLPLLFVPFRSRWMLLAIVPLAEVLFSRMSTTFTMGTHYAGAWIGYVLAAYAAGLICIAANRPLLARRIAMWSAAVCVLELAVANPLHPGLNLRAVQPRDVALDTFLRTLPGNAAIATQEEAYTHLALADPHATVLPEFSDVALTTCLALTDGDFPDSPRLEEYGVELASLASRGRYVAVETAGEITLYRRAGCVPTR